MDAEAARFIELLKKHPELEEQLEALLTPDLTACEYANA
jgi:hypothetical protein